MVLTNDAIPKPVGSGGDGHAFGTDGKLENLADNDPPGWSPGAVALSVDDIK